MRVTKEPEVRKQEILDTALKLFGENGYEKTSITDIAKAIGVAQVYAIAISRLKRRCLTARLNNMRMSWWSSLSVLKRTITRLCGRSLKICLPLWKNGIQNIIQSFTAQKTRNSTISFLSKFARSWFHL
mgnify:CR=1 FL=1